MENILFGAVILIVSLFAVYILYRIGVFLDKVFDKWFYGDDSPFN